MELFKSKQEQESFVSDYKNPFMSDKCERIFMHIRKDIFSEGEIIYEAVVKFKNGNTSGEQQIDASDFPSLVKKVEQFIKSL